MQPLHEAAMRFHDLLLGRAGFQSSGKWVRTRRRSNASERGSRYSGDANGRGRVRLPDHAGIATRRCGSRRYGLCSGGGCVSGLGGDAGRRFSDAARPGSAAAGAANALAGR